MKFSIPEKSIAVRLQTTTSQPVSLSTSRRRPSLSRKTVELVRLYFRYSLKKRPTEASGLSRVLSFHTKKYEIT